MLVNSLTNVKNGKPVQLFAHSLNQHLLIVGQTGSGKTTSTVALLSDYQRANHAAIILDPTGEYRHLPNASVYRLGDNCYLSAGELLPAQLLEVLSLPQSKEWLHLLTDAITSLRVAQNINHQAGPLKKAGLKRDEWVMDVRQLGQWAHDYRVDLLSEQLLNEMVLPNVTHPNYELMGQVADRDRIRHNWALINHLRTQLADTRLQRLFGAQTKATSYDLTYVLRLFLRQPMQHQSLVFDLSLLQGQMQLQQLLVSLICQVILHIRLTAATHFPVTIVIDEAHRYLPQEERQLAGNGIFQILREGRKVNLAMMMTTQSPLDLAPRLRSQFANVLFHRLSSEEAKLWPDIDANLVTHQAVGDATYLSNQQSIQVNITQPQWWREEHLDGLHS